MIVVIRKKATEEEIKKMAEDFDGFIKVVVDLEQEILAGGGERHFDAEQKLLAEGSKQENLWGGGIDLETKTIDCNSFINIRPAQMNTSNEIQNETTRDEFTRQMKYFFREIYGQ